MLGLSRTGRRLMVALLPLLAATLACNALTPGGPTSPLATQAAATAGAALTAGAATANAILNQSATLQASVPTEAPLPSEAPTAAASATKAATSAPTAAATAAATEAGAATPVQGGPTAPAGSAAVVDPCSLVSAEEAEALTTVKMGPSKAQSGGCVYVDAATGLSAAVVIYALPPSQSGFFFNQLVTQLKQSGVSVPADLADQITQTLAAGDVVAAANALFAVMLNQDKLPAKKVDGVGSAAIWSWGALPSGHNGFLMAVKPGALVVVAVLVPSQVKEADEQAAITTIVSRTLDQLPAQFTIAGLQSASAAAVLDPCSLATAADIQAITGVKPAAGTVQAGNCVFQDPANKTQTVRVFAYPKGVSATDALTGIEDLVLAGDSDAEATVLADLSLGDLVAAVHDIGAKPANSSVRVLQSVDGLGKSAFFFVQTLGTARAGYLIAATPNAIAGVQFLIGTGDNTVTEAAAQGLVTRMLAGLPDTFTINGVP